MCVTCCYHLMRIHALHTIHNGGNNRRVTSNVFVTMEEALAIVAIVTKIAHTYYLSLTGLYAIKTELFTLLVHLKQSEFFKNLK